MDERVRRPWSCYPHGLEPSRRAFLRALGAAAVGLAASRAVPGQESAPDAPAGPPPSGIPAEGFAPGAVRLNFNENPLGPSPEALRAIRADGLAEANRYNVIHPLIRALAEHHGVAEENVLVGCGSTEFLQFVPWALFAGGGNIVLPSPTYGWSAGVVEAMGGEARRVPLKEDGSADPAALTRAVDRQTRMLYVANPNNPTGASLSFDEVSSLARALPPAAVLMVDEAYSQFLPKGKTAVDLAAAGFPVIALRTFSKAFGMAGLRLGYMVAPEAIVEKVKTVWWEDLGINAAANAAGPAALADRGHIERYVRTVDEGLLQLRSELGRFGFACMPHRAPFFMVDLGRQAKPVVRALAAKNVWVRDGSAWDMPSHLRVSVGLPEENEGFLKALTEVLRTAA